MMTRTRRLLAAGDPDTCDPTCDVWRHEFQLRREDTTGFRLYTEPDAEDDKATIEAELAAEDLPHLGTLPRFFRYQDNGAHSRRPPLPTRCAAASTSGAIWAMKSKPGGASATLA